MPVGYFGFGFYDPSLVTTTATPSGSPWPLFLAIRRRRRGISVIPVAADLMAAMVIRLRSVPAVVSALQEDTSDEASTKIWADFAVKSDPPYLTYSEPSENLSPESIHPNGLIHYYGKGTLTLTVTETSKIRCRSTAKTICSAIGDAPLIFGDGKLLELRHTNPTAPITPGMIVGGTQTFTRVLTYEYVTERTF